MKPESHQNIKTTKSVKIILIFDQGKGSTNAKPICKADKKIIPSMADKNRRIEYIASAAIQR